MWPPSPELTDHPDRLRWNARYSGDYVAAFRPHPLAAEALRLARLPLGAGPVLELAAGHPVTVIDISDAGLGLLAAEASRRGLAERLTLVHADLARWVPGADRYAVVLCTNFWERAVFDAALRAVAGDGVLAWESLTEAAREGRPQLPAQWCVGPGEPASLLPPEFDVIDQHDVPGQPGQPPLRRQLLARRRRATS